MADKNNKSVEVNPQIISSSLEKNIPKFCTAVNIGVLESGHFVISMAFNDSPENPTVLIDRVIVDLEHAKKIKNVFEDLISKFEEKHAK